MTDGSGAVVPNSQAAYLPFGDWRNEPSTADLTDVGYTGHHHNNTASNDLGLIYMNARYYVPSLARFASADTIIPNPHDSQTYNKYSYVNNSPLNYTDPSGHCATYPDGSRDEACWDYLENDFCNDQLCGDGTWRQWIVVGLEGIWTKDELEVIHHTLLAVKHALEGVGIGDWASTFGGVKFYRSQEDRRAFYTPREDRITLSGRWQTTGRFNKSWRLTPKRNAFRTVLHELGHAFDVTAGGLSNLIPVETFRDSTFTADGYYYRHYGRLGDAEQAPYDGREEGFADIFAAWVWNDAYIRGNRTYAYRRHIAPPNGVNNVGNLHPINWDAIYSLMTSLIEE